MKDHSIDHCESELKFRLSKKEYEALIKHFKCSSKNILLNYFFDTKKCLLFSNKIGLRLRIKNNRSATITLKKANLYYSSLPALNVRYELEEKIPITIAKKVLINKENILDLKNIESIKVIRKIFPRLKRLRLLGCLRTERRMIKPRRLVQLELDKCEVGKRCFYELELEIDNNASLFNDYIKKLFKDLKIKYRPTRITKLQQLINSLRM